MNKTILLKTGFIVFLLDFIIGIIKKYKLMKKQIKRKTIADLLLLFI